MVAHALGVPSHAVTVEVRRMGGGFGGKETQGNQFAALAAIAAKRLGRAVKIRPDRDDDMIATGKRHDFVVDYEVGFDDEGNILGVDFIYAARCGFSADLSGPVTRPGAVPLRQRLFLSRREGGLGAALHQHRLQHRLPRLRRAAGHGGGRARHRRDRLRAGQGPAGNPQGEFLRRTRRWGRPQRDALPPDGRGQHRRSASSPRSRRARTISRRRARSRPSTPIPTSSSAASR